MSLSSLNSTRRRLSAIGLVLIGLFANFLWHAEASAAPRNFLMSLWQSSERAYTDLDWFWVSATPVQPSRTAILRLDGWYLVPEERELLLQVLESPAYDWSKIAAVFIDEPYLNAVGPVRNPCNNRANSTKTVNAQVALATVADKVRLLSPSTRFWVNFSKNEIDWMISGRCSFSFNQSYIDVVSIDYYQPFSDVKPYYDWLKANPATNYQQRALVPLVASKQAPNAIAPETAAAWLQGYFDYATTENQTCDLPIGRTGVTKVGDRCSVWIVTGWPGVDYSVDNYVGFYDPSSAPIREAWHSQRRITRSDRIGMFDAFDVPME